MKRISHILLYMCIAILAVAGLVSCDVHEFPDDGEQGGGETKEFVLLLDFTDALKWGFYTEIDYTQNRVPSMLPLRPADIDVRYIVKAYRVDANGSVASEPSAVVMEAGTDTTNLNHTVTLQLESTENIRVFGGFLRARGVFLEKNDGDRGVFPVFGKTLFCGETVRVGGL